MVTELKELKVTSGDWKSSVKPTWCPGCGDFGVLSASKKGLVDVQWLPNNTVVVSGIGCSSNFPHFLGGYGLHTLHGRSIPAAEGVKLSNPDLNVLVTGGDGDGLGIGLAGFIHAARRNVDLTYIVMDNQVYGLTVNQVSPTSSLGRVTKSTPYGNIENPLNPITMALAAGATFVARTYSKESSHFQEVVKRAMEHKGFSFIDALSPCVTFNKVNTFEFWNERVYKLEETEYKPTDLNQAFLKSQEWGNKVPIGVFYEVSTPVYSSMDETNKKFGNVISRGAHKISPETIEEIIKDFK